jgi:hypothetical protein
MFEGWSEFYLLAGSAAAVLIGLIFVVVTLMNDRPRSSVLFGSWLFMGPVVLHVSFVLVLSAAALVPGIDAHGFAAFAAVIALWGLFRGVSSVLGIRRLGANETVHWTDVWFYGVAPAAIYLALIGVALGFWTGAAWAPGLLAAVIVALLLISIRNEWDLVTWLAPKGDDDHPGTPDFG